MWKPRALWGPASSGCQDSLLRHCPGLSPSSYTYLPLFLFCSCVHVLPFVMRTVTLVSMGPHHPGWCVIYCSLINCHCNNLILGRKSDQMHKKTCLLWGQQTSVSSRCLLIYYVLVECSQSKAARAETAGQIQISMRNLGNPNYCDPQK